MHALIVMIHVANYNILCVHGLIVNVYIGFVYTIIYVHVYNYVYH